MNPTQETYNTSAKQASQHHLHFGTIRLVKAKRPPFSGAVIAAYLHKK